ncbi:MAG: VOC family protein [Pseudomonadota bacterium]
MTNIIRRSHGFQLDHIGLGVPDTKEGVKWVEEQTGAKVDLHAPEPDQFYWSGSLAIGDQSFLEIIGPNPNYKKFQPFAALMKTLSEPRLLFWYIAVDDFAAFQELARQTKAKLERVEGVNIEGGETAQASYWRGLIGPGFLSERPNVIEWIKRPNRESQATPECKLMEFQLANPQADEINQVFTKLGIDVPVSNGKSSIGITIDTPKGRWEIENEGVRWTMPGMLLEIAALWWRTRNQLV